MYVADQSNHHIHKLITGGHFIQTIGQYGDKYASQDPLLLTREFWHSQGSYIGSKWQLAIHYKC